MKRITVMILTVILTVVYLMVPASASPSANPVIIMSGNVAQDGSVTVNADLTANPGLSAMTLSVEFDPAIFKLDSIDKGEALASLDFMVTGAETTSNAQKVLFDSDGNDFTTGVFLIMKLSVRETVPDGDYRVSLEYERDADVIRLSENGIETLNPIIDAAVISLKSSRVVSIDAQSSIDNRKDAVNVLIITISFVAVAAGSVITVLLMHRRKRKKKEWIKI